MKLRLEKFNLGLAVSGARKVVTREGCEVTELIYNNRAYSWPLHGYVNGLEVLWSIDGTYELGGAENGLDLFLMPEEVKLKTKDFELSDIEAGCKFVTRGGKEVKNLFNSGKKFFCIGGEVDEDQEWWSKGGKYTIADEDNNMDLMTVVEEDQSIFGLNEEQKKDFTEKFSAEIVNTINEVMNDQPQGIKAYIETGRIKCAEEPHESAPPQSINAEEPALIQLADRVIENREHDAVNKPSHYTDGKIEVIDFIDDKGFDYCIGNAIKYLSRAGKKQNEIEDLEKAVWYINHKIKLLRDENS